MSPSCQTLSQALETSRRTIFVECVFCWALDMVSWKMARAVSLNPTPPESVLVVVVEMV